jgi:hypothetical protein
MQKAARNELTRFRHFYSEGNVPLREDCLPSSWKNLADLSEKYEANVERAARQEERAQEQLETIRKDMPPPRDDYVTKAELERKLDLFAEEIGSFIRKEAAPMTYVGVWQAGVKYAPRTTVSYDGSMFHCNEETTDKPGSAGGAWTLAVKRGRDGRDAAR